ncbi:hypothetical protein BDV41DRAFT_582740 [Aspergillus transmontanensis]|uniref:Uncharacterized protein n=1 Tax=Aspergillus transmontanensis TaxID=1034304 RepID=A0A5N6VFC1_9EURO|nr:hypothetical protein BDV41DRAFT_582740 [Aspergillus transmontanensis]
MKPPLVPTLQAAAFPPCPPEIFLPDATRVERRKRGLAASTERVRELRSRRGVETSGRVTVKNFADGLGQWAHLAGGRRSAFHHGTGAKKARRCEEKKETLSSSDALDAYIVAAAQRRGGGRRQFPFGDGVARQTGLGHAKPEMAWLRRPLNPNGAAVHMVNGRFANYMRQHGQKRKIVSAEGQEGTDSDTGQIFVTEEQMSAWIKELYDRTRGRELPGNYNHALLGKLFHEQSSRWADIARGHVTTIADFVSRFIQAASEFVIKDPSARDNILRIIVAKLDENAECAFHELCKLLDDEAGCPITYNHYYTDNVQRARNNRSRQDLGTSLNNAINEDWNGRFHVSNSCDEISRLVASLQNHGVIVDMEERACYEA